MLVHSVFECDHVAHTAAVWQTSETDNDFLLCRNSCDKDACGEDSKCAEQFGLMSSKISDHTKYFGIQAALLNPCKDASDDMEAEYRAQAEAQQAATRLMQKMQAMQGIPDA